MLNSSNENKIDLGFSLVWLHRPQYSSHAFARIRANEELHIILLNAMSRTRSIAPPFRNRNVNANEEPEENHYRQCKICRVWLWTLCEWSRATVRVNVCGGTHRLRFANSVDILQLYVLCTLYFILTQILIDSLCFVDYSLLHIRLVDAKERARDRLREQILFTQYIEVNSPQTKRIKRIHSIR